MGADFSPATERDVHFMGMALELARKAAAVGETPVGAVLEIGGGVYGTGHNLVETHKDAGAHAEIIAIRQAGARCGDWRLSEARLYVTLEPCIMCAAAILHARIKSVIFGAYDDKWGAFGSLFDFSHDPRLNHEVEIISGVMAEEARGLLKDFFGKLR